MGAPQLNIKDAAITAMVRELAELTGESRTEAVRKAVQQRLEREKAERLTDADEIVRKLKAVSAQGSANKLPDATSDHAFLYDDDGAPI